MEGFEGSFFEDLRQLEFEEKPLCGTTSILPVSSGTGISGSADSLVQGIFPDEESVDLSSFFNFSGEAFEKSTSTSIASTTRSSSTGLHHPSSYPSSVEQKHISWPGLSAELNVNVSFLSMYDVSSASSTMPVNVEHVPSTNNPTPNDTQVEMSSLVGTRPAPGKATRPKKKRMPVKGTLEYREKRDKNNVAVRKSREKSKQRVQETEERVKELESENQQLQSKIALLTKELNVLKCIFTTAGVSEHPSEDLGAQH